MVVSVAGLVENASTSNQSAANTEPKKQSSAKCAGRRRVKATYPLSSNLKNNYSVHNPEPNCLLNRPQPACNACHTLTPKYNCPTTPLKEDETRGYHCIFKKEKFS
jgi:hypothetical protein